MVFARFPSAGCLSLWHVCCDNTDVLFSVRHFLKMTTFASSTKSYSDWKRIKCSKDELRLDVTLASGQSFRLESCCL